MLLKTPQQKFSYLCRTLPQQLLELMPQHIPQTGKTKGFSLCIDVPFSNWCADTCGLMIAQSYQGDDLRTLEVYARPANSGYVIKHMVTFGTTAEIAAYLRQPQFAASLETTFADFNKKLADKGYPL